MRSGKTLTRRELCLLAAGSAGACALGLSGCGCSMKSEAERFRAGEIDSRTGFSSDTEVKSYPVTITVLADEALQWFWGGSAAAVQLGATGLDRLHEYVVRYQAQEDRDQVDVQIVYLDAMELDEEARGGFSRGDGMIALAESTTAGNEAGTVDGGAGEYLVRNLAYNFSERCVLVTSSTSGTQLPRADTLDGGDAPDGSINRLQKLPELEGAIAIAAPETTVEGRKANSILASQGYYSGEDALSGAYAQSIADKVVKFETQDAAMAAVASGECSIGFALHSQVGTRYPGVLEIYNPAFADNSLSYAAAALARSPEPGVTRDFFEFILSCTD